MKRKTLEALLDRGARTAKPRRSGVTLVIDKGQMGPNSIADFASIAGDYCDFVKIAWGSALITGGLEAKLECYRKNHITTMLGGTLFEYAFLRNKLPELLAFARAYEMHIEVSDGVIELPRRDKLHWIEKFAKHLEVFSEVGGKIVRQNHDWKQVIAEEFAAGAQKVVIEGREIGPVGQEIRVDFIEHILSVADPEKLVFEAFERKQQVWFIKRLGPNVNLGNIPPTDLLTLESFRLGLKEHTLLHTFEKQARAAKPSPTESSPLQSAPLAVVR